MKPLFKKGNAPKHHEPILQEIRKAMNSKRGRLEWKTFVKEVDMGKRHKDALGYWAMLASSNFGLDAYGFRSFETLKHLHKAGKQGNPRWSAKRWEREFRKIQKIRDYAPVRSIDNEYPEYLLNAPKQWQPYVITNKKRFMLEGLRQGHCMSSQGMWEETTECKDIPMSIVVDKKRYTIVGYQHDLSIEIYGKHNATPTKNVIQKIYKRLGTQQKKTTIIACVDLPAHHIHIDTRGCTNAQIIG